MDSRLRGNDAIDTAVIAATTVIPAKAGIHTTCPNTNAVPRHANAGITSLTNSSIERFCSFIPRPRLA